MLLGKPAVSEQPAKGQQSSKGSESGKDTQPIDKDKVMNPAKQPAPSKVVLLPAHRGTFSSGREGSDRALDGLLYQARVGNNWLACQRLKVAHMRNSYQNWKLSKFKPSSDVCISSRYRFNCDCTT